MMYTGHLQHRAVSCYEMQPKLEALFNQNCAAATAARHKECIDGMLLAHNWLFLSFRMTFEIYGIFKG